MLSDGHLVEHQTLLVYNENTFIYLYGEKSTIACSEAQNLQTVVAGLASSPGASQQPESECLLLQQL